MITLSSDFGWPYPAAMRGVIAARTPARLLDVSHEFPRGDVHTAAFWLREILPWFPPAVHLAVVDPGVGTGRDVLAIDAGEHVLVGPDNGLLWPVARALDRAPSPFRLTSFEAPSETFHGRDVFAPLAAEVHELDGWELPAHDRLARAEAPVDLRFPDPNVCGRRAEGEILVIDVFGNAVTNVDGTFVSDSLGATVAVDGEPVPVRRTYGEVPPGDPVVTVGSHGKVELAVRDGRGANAFGVDVGSPVRLEKE